MNGIHLIGMINNHSNLIGMIKLNTFNLIGMIKIK